MQSVSARLQGVNEDSLKVPSWKGLGKHALPCAGLGPAFQVLLEIKGRLDAKDSAAKQAVDIPAQAA